MAAALRMYWLEEEAVIRIISLPNRQTGLFRNWQVPLKVFEFNIQERGLIARGVRL
jgi:hypothetical protein